jgi:electron transport complex protein RnfG
MASAQAPTGAPTMADSMRMVAAMGVVGLVASTLIVLTYTQTRPVIAKNKQRYLNEAVYAVLPGAESQRPLLLTGDGAFVPASKAAAVAGLTVYAGYNKSGELVGFAIPASGQGFQDRLALLYGYDATRQVVVGMKVLESRETPGLGDKIEKDPAFRANFEALDVALDAAGTALAHPLALVPAGTRQSGWEVDSITGATISARAVTTILRESGSTHLPGLQQAVAAGIPDGGGD